jgi:murein DD-endopeptidase MepM/ murein hydrolase activator NlpD
MLIVIISFCPKSPCRTALMRALLLFAIYSLAPLCLAAELRLQVHARAFAPGEPLRVEVDITAPVESVEGAFLGQPLHFVARDASGRHWEAWSMIGLDETNTSAEVEVRASANTWEATAREEIRIESRDFPEERLEVASRYVEPLPEVEARLAGERETLKRIYALRSDFAPQPNSFVRPVTGDPTSVFGTRRIFNGKPRSPHPGLDLRAATGTSILSSGAGRVVLAQDLYYSGNTVIVDHGGGLFTIYAHLSAIEVSESQEIAPGEQLGLAGATGRVTGPHLHWGAKIGDRPFDPTALLAPELYGSD